MDNEQSPSGRRSASRAGFEDFVITIHLRGYGSPEQVEREYRQTLTRMLKLEFAEQVQSAKIEHIIDIDLRTSNGSYPPAVRQ